MIAVDTSALMAILLEESGANACAAVLGQEERVLISAGTVAEALIVAARRGVETNMEALLDLGFDIIPVTPARARQIAEAYKRWGKGVHPAALNFGDCFAYDVAKEHDCRLLFVGNDFAKTDIVSALD